MVREEKFHGQKVTEDVEKKFELTVKYEKGVHNFIKKMGYRTTETGNFFHTQKNKLKNMA